MPTNVERDKFAVAQSFSKAAASYDSVAELQRSVGSDLLALVPAFSAQDSAQGSLDLCVDVGSGTGFFTEQLAQRFPACLQIGVDIAEGMLRFAKMKRHPGIQWLGGDMESLPLKPGCVDLFFTSLAVQWSERLEDFFAEMTRCLKPGGILALATLGPDTLCELRESWRAVDGFTHVNNFASADVLRESARTAGLVELIWRAETRVMYYPALRDLTHELKALGAHNVNHQRAPGLTAPKKLKQLREHYERFRRARGLPASYAVYWLVLQKPPR